MCRLDDKYFINILDWSGEWHVNVPAVSALFLNYWG